MRKAGLLRSIVSVNKSRNTRGYASSGQAIVVPSAAEFPATIFAENPLQTSDIRQSVVIFHGWRDPLNVLAVSNPAYGFVEFDYY